MDCTDVGRVVRRTKDELGRTVVAGADVADVWLPGSALELSFLPPHRRQPPDKYGIAHM